MIRALLQQGEYTQFPPTHRCGLCLLELGLHLLLRGHDLQQGNNNKT